MFEVRNIRYYINIAVVGTRDRNVLRVPRGFRAGQTLGALTSRWSQEPDS